MYTEDDKETLPIAIVIANRYKNHRKQPKVSYARVEPFSKEWLLLTLHLHEIRGSIPAEAPLIGVDQASLFKTD